jgi:type I restriction enzyme S subunit
MATNQDNELPEGFKTTELGLLPQEWEVVRLGEVLEEVDRRVKEIGLKDIPILSMTRHNGLILQQDKFEKRVASRDISKYKVVEKGQIAYGFPMDEGVIYALRKFAIGAVSPVYEVWKLTSGIVDSDFLDHSLRTPSMIGVYKQLTSTTVQRRRIVSKRDFRKITISLPPLPEQKAIARVLSTIQRAIETQDKVIAAMRELKKSLMKHLFTYGPVSVAEAEQVPLRETEIGLMPQHWEVMRLGDVIDKPEYGYTATASSKVIGPKFLRITDIQNSGVDWVSVPYCACPSVEEGKYRLQSGDILFARIGATTGKTYIVRDSPPAIFASYLIRVRCKSSLLPGYLSQFTTTDQYWNQINASKGGRLKQGINIPALKSLLVPFPSLPEQQEIALVLSSMDKKIEAEENRKAVLQNLFKTMLHLLMTGQIRVKDLEAKLA